MFFSFRLSRLGKNVLVEVNGVMSKVCGSERQMIETSRFVESRNHGDVFHCVVDAEGGNFDVHLDPRQRLLMSNCELCRNKVASRSKDAKLALLLQEQAPPCEAPPCNPPPRVCETDFPSWLAARKMQWGSLRKEKPSATAKKPKNRSSRPSIIMFPGTPSGTIDCRVEGHSLSWCPCSFLEMKPPSARRPTHQRPTPGVVPDSWIDKTCLMGEIGSAALPLISVLFGCKKRPRQNPAESSARHATVLRQTPVTSTGLGR